MGNSYSVYKTSFEIKRDRCSPEVNWRKDLGNSKVSRWDKTAWPRQFKFQIAFWSNSGSCKWFERQKVKPPPFYATMIKQNRTNLGIKWCTLVLNLKTRYVEEKEIVGWMMNSTFNSCIYYLYLNLLFLIHHFNKIIFF